LDEELLAAGTCAVLVGGKRVGTAWLLDAEGHLLTAGHVLGLDTPVDRVEVLFLDESDPRPAERIDWRYDFDRGLDFAVLKLAAPPPGRKPLPVRLTRKPRGSFQLHGFGVTLVDLSSAAGTFVGPYYPLNRSDNRLFTLDSRQAREGGYSGAAVYSDAEHAVVAIQVEGTTVPGADAQGTTVLAMPLYRVADACPELRSLAAADDPASRSWYSYHVYLSYDRGGVVETWVDQFFRHELGRWLRENLVPPTDPQLFFDHEPHRQRWDVKLTDAIRNSCCLVPIYSSGYWQSQQCLAELDSFAIREREENRALTLGALFHDKGMNPAGPMPAHVDFRDHTGVFDGFRSASTYGLFQNQVKVFARQLAEMIASAPFESERWWPVTSPQAMTPPPAARIPIVRPTL